MVATISNTGEIVPTGVGQTTIIARTANGTLDNFILAVRYPFPNQLNFNNLPTDNTMIVTQVHQIATVVLPANAFPREIEFISSNPNVATISSTGIITANYPGTTTITARIGNHVTGQFTLTVNWPTPETITISNRPVNDQLIIGQTQTLSSIIYPPLAQPSNRTNYDKY